MKINITPGPWRDTGDWYELYGNQIIGRPYQTIAVAPSDADSQAISAVPEMLAVLVELARNGWKYLPEDIGLDIEEALKKAGVME